MAKRLKTRLSAGAALVTGLGMMGLATAVPAQAAPVTATQTFECTYDVLNVGPVDGDPTVTVEMSADLPSEVEAGSEVSSAVTAVVTIPEQRRDSLYGLLGVRSVDGPDAAGAAAEDGGLNSKNARNQADFTISDGSTTGDASIPLEVPVTNVPASGNLVVTATGAIPATTLETAGEYTITAGDFQAYIRGYERVDGDGYKTNVTLDCTNVSENKTLATITVTEATGEPTDPDPSGTPTDEPTDPDPSGTPTDEPTDPDPSGTPTDEPTDPSGTSTDEPTDPGTTPEPSATVGDGDGDDGPTDPQTPGVVQTDDASVLSGGNNAALLLGGVLLAGAGAGAVTIARRRSSSQH